MKILYVTTIGGTMRFFRSFIQELIEEGNTVDIATNECGGESEVPEVYRELGCKIFPVSCSRNPAGKGNLKAIAEIKRIVSENNYDIVHCHTPVAAACTRLACKSIRNHKPKVFYTAHGFHFFKGAPIKNWVLFYPVEKWLSKYTDTLITINTEDEKRAKEKFNAKKIVYVPGVGIDTQLFCDKHNGKRIREEFHIPDDEFLLLSVGELNENKNHEVVIKAISGMAITYVIAGAGPLKDYLETLSEKEGSKVILAGFRSDIDDFYDAADAFILPSFREGLNVSLMEAMASGLPCLASDIRGNTDLIDNNGGALFDPHSVEEVKSSIGTIIDCSNGMGEYNRKKIQSFDVRRINRMMKQLYEDR